LPIDQVYLTAFDLTNLDPVNFMKEVRMGIDLNSKITRKNIKLNQLEMKQHFDKSVVPHSYVVGSMVQDPVCRPDEHPKLRCKFRGPFRITYLTSHDCHLENPTDGKIISKMINLNRVKLFYQRDDNFFEDFTDPLVPDEGNTNDTSSTVPVVVADQGQTDPLLLAEPEVNPPVQTALGRVHVDDGTMDVVQGKPVANPIISVGDLPSVLVPDRV